MRRPAVTKAEWRLYRRTLTESHTKLVNVSVLNLEGDSLERLSPVVVDGQVNVDASADVTRSARVTFYDPTHALNFDSDSPDDGALYADRMLRIAVSINGPLLDDRVSVPVFTGPLVAFSRDGAFVTVECQGKELFGLGQSWGPMTFPKGAKKTDVIRAILEEKLGETRMAIPDLDVALPRPVVLGRKQQPWKVASRIARSMNRQLYYDGAGVCRLRPLPKRPLWSFRADSGRVTLTSPLTVSADLTDVRNVVWVRGGKAKGAKKRVGAVATAPRGHALSPWNLGRNDVRRNLLDVVSNDDVRSKQEAERLADRILNDRLRQMVSVRYDALPVYHLDPLDLVRVVTDDTSLEHRMTAFSIPLGIGGPMSVGYWKDVTLTKRRRRGIR